MDAPAWKEETWDVFQGKKNPQMTGWLEKLEEISVLIY